MLVSTNYHPEIDGLRALAIIPVILLHAGEGFLLLFRFSNTSKQ